MSWGRIGVFAGALVFGGCTSTVQLPATELPALGTQRVQMASEWPEVRTLEGKPEKIIGNIESIVISGNQGSEPIRQPFAARVNGPYLETFGPAGPRGFPLTNDLKLTVEYDDLKKSRNVTGGVLLGVGGSFFASGIVVYRVGSDAVSRSDVSIGGFFSGAIGGTLMVFGTLGILTGLGMTIPGIVLLATDPKKPENDTARIQPKLRIGPAGADLSLTF